MKKVFGYSLTLLSLLAGMFIYLVWREPSNPFYQWSMQLGIIQEVNFTRNLVANFQMPSWIVYSLPDGLWMFSFILFMLIIWDFKISGPGKFWIIFSIIAGISFEVSQAFMCNVGVFDWIDLLILVVGTILALLFLIKQNIYEKVF